MAKLNKVTGKVTAAAASAVLLLTAMQFPAALAVEDPVLRMNLLGGGSVIGIGYQLEVPDALSAYTVTLDGEKVTPAQDGTFASYDYAAYMTQPHTVTVKRGDRQVLKKETSVCSYLNTLLADSAYSEYHEIAKAMLVYGGAAQAYFGIDTAHPADAGIDCSELQMKEIPEDAFSKENITGSSVFDFKPIHYTGMNLSLQSEIQFSLYFETNSGCTAEEAEQSLKNDLFGGEPAVVTPYGENGFRVSRTVNVKDLSKTLEYTFMDEDDSAAFGFRPTQYLTLAEQTGDEALIRVCRALYQYSAAVKPKPVRSIEMQQDEFWDWAIGEHFSEEEHTYSEDDTKKYAHSIPDQLCLERTDESGQTVKIPVKITESWEIQDEYAQYVWNPEVLVAYRAAEASLCSLDSDYQWFTHVSATVEEGEKGDVLQLFFTEYELSGSFGIQSLKLDETGKLTVRTSYLNEADNADGPIVYYYRMEFPKGTLSGEYMPEDDGGQQPEQNEVIRSIKLNPDYYYDLEKMSDSMYGDPTPEMLVKDPEAFRASVPEKLCISRTDGTGKTVQIPVLDQKQFADERPRVWSPFRPTAPEWLKREDYSAAEKATCDPMYGMQRVSARYETGDETDVLMLYFTWNSMDGDLELQGLQFDENGELTVNAAFCRTTVYGWGSDIYAYRLELPHGALTGEWKPEDTGEGQTEADDAIKSLELKIDSYYEPLFETTSFDDWDTEQTETTAEVRDYKAFKASLPDELTIEKTDGAGQTVQIPVTVLSRTLGEQYNSQEKKYDWDWSGNPEFQAAYEAAEASLVSPTVVLDLASGNEAHVSAKLEPGEETDTLWLFFPMARREGQFGIQGIRLDENGRMIVSAAVYDGGGCESETVLEVCRLELPHGALS